MRRSAFAGPCLAVLIGAAGCQESLETPTAPAESATAFARSSAVAPGLDLPDVALPMPARVADLLPPDAARGLIDPGDYVCPPSTPVIDWYVDEALEAINGEPEILTQLFALDADLIPTFEALYLLTEDTPQYFGYDGEYTRVLEKTERDVKRFWDIFSDDIQMLGLHGSMLLDVERVAATYEFVYGMPPDLALFYATIVRETLLQSEILDGGDHSLFSFNAFALSTNVLPIPDKIVIGDGVLAGYEALGFDDVAPQAIYAHEFAHHIQYENDYFDDPYATTGSAAEQTRYTELMADAMAAYYLTHKRGGTLNRKRVEQFLAVFFQLGDCSFGSSGHHGTPNQRLAAARFGFDIADNAQKQGHILSAEQFHDLFVAVYPEIIAPDAS